MSLKIFGIAWTIIMGLTVAALLAMLWLAISKKKTARHHAKHTRTLLNQAPLLTRSHLWSHLEPETDSLKKYETAVLFNQRYDG